VEFEEICRRIPHRPPFLWLDRVLTCSRDEIIAEKDIAADLELFQGHYPAHPLMPGVLLCEAVFQAGALLLSERLDGAAGMPVLTRIYNARFKRQVRPGETIRIRAKFTEKIGAAWLMKGRVLVGGKTAVSVRFACAMSGGTKS
jgi:3-hydroxyacyl-[acyl-carrier-protein] dehydratase